MITVGGSYRPLAPQAFAETAPQFFSSYFVPRVGVQLATSFVTYGAMYQIQPWIHAVVDKIAMYMARIGVNGTTPVRVAATCSTAPARTRG